VSLRAAALAVAGPLALLAFAAGAAQPAPAAAKAAPAAVAAAALAPAAVALAGVPGDAGGGDWAKTLERIVGSVVSIQIDQTRAFDTERNTTAQATGFVVDAARGLVLTNRHVVTPGPVTAGATFLDREEVQLYPVYRDPVHDFGIYRYDPSKLRFITPRSLPLAPEAAQVGREIRVIGNNAGEQLSILAGTLARLDREAPQYGVGRYNDFNTFYIQAASGTSGGSSGSPVVDVQGQVVALNAGGATGAASSFYLPLGRVQRALKLIQAGKGVPRGTLQVEFKYRPYDELQRLGLRPGTETEARTAKPDNTGMLVVDNVQAGSPSDQQLQPGDILVRMNGQPVTGFEPLEALLDDHVGGEITLELERGGEPYKAQLAVQDLHAITPDAFLEIGEAVLHTLSYQEARHFHLPVRGVFVASPGYSLDAAGVPRGAVITELNGRPIDNLADLINSVTPLADGARFSLRYVTLEDPKRSELRSVHLDRRWFPARRCQRNDASGYWDCAELPASGTAAAPVGGSTAFPASTEAAITRMAPSLVGITFDMPYPISGVTERNYHGMGLVIDAARGLVVTDRNTVPVSIGDVRLTFAGTLEIPARVVYVHPLHDLAVVQYDPALVGKTPVKSAVLATQPLRAGEPVDVIGLDSAGELKSRSTAIAAVDPIALPLARPVAFRDSNLDVATLVNPPDELVGVLADRSGRVRGLWASFASDNGRELVQETRGIGADLVADTLALVRSGQPLHSLEVDLRNQPLSVARDLGLSSAWAARIQQANRQERKVLAVARLVAGSEAARLLQTGDLLLAVDGQVVTQFRDVERAVAARESVQVTVWRGEGERTFTIRTAALSGQDIDRVLLWAGATLQAPHRALAVQRGVELSGVYISFFAFGSPAARFGLAPGRRIVEVDGQATPDLDAFLRRVSGRADRSSLRIKTVAWNNAVEMITLKLDRHYFPTYELRRVGSDWERRQLE
jgi:S1-C subfamily serine protease